MHSLEEGIREVDDTTIGRDNIMTSRASEEESSHKGLRRITILTSKMHLLKSETVENKLTRHESEIDRTL